VISVDFNLIKYKKWTHSALWNPHLIIAAADSIWYYTCLTKQICKWMPWNVYGIVISTWLYLYYHVHGNFTYVGLYKNLINNYGVEKNNCQDVLIYRYAGVAVDKNTKTFVKIDKLFGFV